MNKPDLNIMDIYPDMLKDEYGLCETILTENYGYSQQDFFRNFDSRLKEMGLDNLSNKLVYAMFEITKEMILDKNPKADVDYYINGSLDTHFYINGELQ